MSPQAATRVLIAEDHAAFREALALVIERAEGLEVAGAAVDAAHAVELAAREQPDIALIDLRMPGGGGAAAARGITARSPRTRMIVLSAYGTPLHEPGVAGHVLKGAAPAEIIRSIKRAAAHSQP